VIKTVAVSVLTAAVQSWAAPKLPRCVDCNQRHASRGDRCMDCAFTRAMRQAARQFDRLSMAAIQRPESDDWK
jgi:tRNA(Ile2) C34 agmatinyltransferase TiaS